MSSDRPLNVLSLDLVRDPGRAVDIALSKGRCAEILGHFYVAWKVLFRTDEREAAADRLLRCLYERGLGHLRPELLRRAEDARAAVDADPELRRALRAQGADLPPAGVPDGGGGEMRTIDQVEARKRFDAELRRSGGVVVSEATLRSQDLFPKFMDALGVLAPDRRDDILADVPGSALSDSSDPWWDSEDCSFLLNEELFDALNEEAPEGYCFGSNEGDGACFGFWAVEED